MLRGRVWPLENDVKSVIDCRRTLFYPAVKNEVAEIELGFLLLLYGMTQPDIDPLLTVKGEAGNFPGNETPFMGV